MLSLALSVQDRGRARAITSQLSMLGVALPSWSSFAVFIVKSRRKDKHFFTKQHFFTKKSTEKNTLIMSTHNKKQGMRPFFGEGRIP
jgi:hypothetical protein